MELNNILPPLNEPQNIKILFDMLLNEEYREHYGINRKELEKPFETAHTDFFTVICEKFPDLNSSLVDLCLFIKLDMTTKEIKAITNITDYAIIKSQQRLKKKLELSADESMYKFIITPDA